MKKKIEYKEKKCNRLEGARTRSLIFFLIFERKKVFTFFSKALKIENS